MLGVLRPDSADPDWFLDPISGQRAPERELAFRIQHRDEAETGNIKQVWEFSRHHHLTVLATAWWLTRDDRYAEAVAAQLRGWWRANPFLTGVHWTSGIEIAIRLISWTWIRRLLDEWPKVGDLFEHDETAVGQIGWHQQYLAAFRSRGSSANNHVIAEAAGLLTAACAFPWYAQSERWRTVAAGVLETQLEANTFPDGVNREQATDYHRFVCELGLVAAVEADASGHSLGDQTWALLGRMLDAAAAFLDVRGAPPRQGDGDEGRAVVLDDPEREPWQILLGTGEATLGSRDWWPALSGSIEASLLGALGRRRDVPRIDRQRQIFPDAGMTILRSRGEDGPEIWCRCDSGPHGFLSIAAHAHADALSLEVRHDGVEILIDPGTYCYHGEPEWRDWFRSTAAHNTLEIGGESQAESGGPFLWSTDVPTSTTASVAGDRETQTWEGHHDGYRRLACRARHGRHVTLHSPTGRILVVDTIRMRPGATVPVRFYWHVGPAVDVVLDDDRAELSWNLGQHCRTATMSLSPDVSWTLRTGEVDPISGWYSPRFGSRIPAPTLVGEAVLSGTTSVSMGIEFS